MSRAFNDYYNFIPINNSTTFKILILKNTEVKVPIFTCNDGLSIKNNESTNKTLMGFGKDISGHAYKR